MKIRYLAALAAIALWCIPAFGQEGTPVKSITGSGVPGGSVAHTVGTEYIDISQNPAVLYVCSSISIAAGPTPPAGTVTCNWTQAGGSGLPANGTVGQVVTNTAPGAGNWQNAAPSSLTTFFTKSTGRAPQDYGAFMDFKACYDINVSGQPTAVITSSSSKTLTNSARTNNVITYTFTNTNVEAGTGITTPLVTPGQSITVTGSNNANGALNVTNVPVLTATGTAITVSSTGANVASAADTGSLVTTVGCMNFNSARDVGKVIEIKGVGAAGALLSTTILSVQSATQATLNANATTNATLQKAWSCHDDTTALQNWVTDINNGIPVDSPLSGGTILIHAGYVPGLGCTTQPLRFINPLGNVGYCGNCGFGTPEPFNGTNASESLYIVGNGPYRSGFVALSTFNWSLPNTSVNNAVFYSLNWNGPTFMNFSVMSPDATVAFNTTANTGKVCGMMSDQNAHEWQNGIQVENFHNTGPNLVGHCIWSGDYGGNFENSQIYGNDYNGLYTGSDTLGSLVDVHFNGMQWLSWSGTAASSGNVMFDSSDGVATHMKNIAINNSAISTCDGFGSSNGSELLFRQNVTISSDEFQLTNTRICVAESSGGFGFVLNTTPTVNASLSNVDISTTNAANTTFTPIFIGGGTNRVKVFGGAMHTAGTLANYCNLPAGSRISFYGTTNGTGATGCSGANYPAGVWEGFESAGKLSGNGNVTASTFGTQTNCAVNSVSPAACGSASSGAVVVPTTTTTYTVNTTAVTAASRIEITPMSFAGNLPSTPTCVVPTTPFIATVSAISAGTSFTMTLPSTTGQTCWQYTIVN